MFVQKRNGTRQLIDEKKITNKINFFVNHLYPLEKVRVEEVVRMVREGLHDGISTSEIDVFTAKRCMDLSILEPQYEVLASRLLINNHHKNTLTSFKDKIEKLYRNVDSSGRSAGLINRTFYKFVCTNQRVIESMIDYERDYLFAPFGFGTLEKQYVNVILDQYVERPQDLLMRIAISLFMNPHDFKDPKALEDIWILYDLMSTHKLTFATPVINNAGLREQQLSSCFLLTVQDSLEGITKVLDDAAHISKFGGGIGIDASEIRSAGQVIRGTNGKSSGIRNFLIMYEKTAKAVNQGGKRNGSFAIFLRDYHPDLLDFIQLKNPSGDENQRARGLFLAVSMSDFFWKTVEANGEWYFVDPGACPGISKMFGEEFEKTMKRLIAEKKYTRSMPAREVMKAIMKQQFESGVPYLVNIDQINKKSNLKHYGPVQSSNLCVEITLPATPFEYGVCNLASLVLPSFVTDTPSQGNLELLRKPVYYKTRLQSPQFDYKGLVTVTRVLTRAMDNVITRNSYSVKEAMVSNLIHRPLGIGSSGLADVFCLMRVPYDSADGVQLSGLIAETIAYAAYSESTLMAKEYRVKGVNEREVSKQVFEVLKSHEKYTQLDAEMKKMCKVVDFDREEYTRLQQARDVEVENPILAMIPLVSQIGPYPSYYYGEGAPISKGEFQWKMWGRKPSGKWDWTSLGGHIAKYGIRNSMLTAQMPTATTAQVMGVNEGVEPYTSNFYKRGVLSGEYLVFNKYLVQDLIDLGVWNEDLKNTLVKEKGSVQNIKGFPVELKELYKTAWDMGQKIHVLHAAARGPFLDHSQSLNAFISNLVPIEKRAGLLYSFLYFGWKMGLKTLIYYLRTQVAMDATKFTVAVELLEKPSEIQLETGEMMKSLTQKRTVKVEVEEGCVVCGT